MFWWPDLYHSCSKMTSEEVGAYLCIGVRGRQGQEMCLPLLPPCTLLRTYYDWLSLSPPQSLRYSDDPTWEPRISVLGPADNNILPSQYFSNKMNPSSTENEKKNLILWISIFGDLHYILTICIFLKITYCRRKKRRLKIVKVLYYLHWQVLERVKFLRIDYFIFNK